MTTRDVEVAPERLERWVAGFHARHGPGPVESAGDVLVHVTGADGAEARFAHFTHDPLGVVLVRRGGYAVGLAQDSRFLTSKVGTRYVQSRTAAGGWSQQRFARRRDNQADALADAVAAHTLRILLHGDESPAGGAGGLPAGLVVGGDRTLVGQVLADHRLRTLTGLPRRELYDLPDPRRDVLDRALQRGRAVRIHLTEPTP
ncbi:MAG: acVLRF1 family peptidyl-tRNA hydrolase [Lapillicoccus sp.]